MNEIGFIEARSGVQLRADPARPPALQIVHDQADMPHFDEHTPLAQLEQLHASVNEEIQSLEIAAQSIADFPSASWEVRVELARQCWDETRHARLFLRRLVARGGAVGDFPIINQEWGVVCSFDSLPARLAVQNRVFEGGSLDVLKEGTVVWRHDGDPETADVVDAVLADEIGHVAFANRWLGTLASADPKGMLQAMSAMSRLQSLNVALTPPEQVVEHDIPLNAEDRTHAGF